MGLDIAIGDEMNVKRNGVEVGISEMPEGIHVSFDATEGKEAVLIILKYEGVKKRTRAILRCFDHPDALRRWVTHTIKQYDEYAKFFKITSKGMVPLKVKR
jgi:hypothetical protein